MSATMLELDDGAQLRTWTTGSVIPRDFPWLRCTAAPGSPTISPRSPTSSTSSAWSIATTSAALADHSGRVSTRSPATFTTWRRCSTRGGHDRVVLLGHSFGTNLAGYFLLAYPERVAGLIQIAGPFLDPWREADRAAQRTRRTDEQQDQARGTRARSESRTDAEEIEYLTLSWCHRPRRPRSGMGWALASARYAAAHQLRDEHPAQRREEGRPTRIPRGRASREPATRRGHHRRGRRHPPRMLPCDVSEHASAARSSSSRTLGTSRGWKRQTSSVRRSAPQWRGRPRQGRLTGSACP